MMRRLAVLAFAATLAAAVLAAMLAAPAGAFELVLGLGRDDILSRSHPAPAATLELRLEPFGRWRGIEFRPGLAADADTDRDLWAGGGMVVAGPFGEGGRWRWILSTMVGVYGRGDGNDLFRNVPVFRGHLELDRQVAAGWRLGLAFGHKSNGGTGGRNPGVETIYLTLGRSF